MCVGPPVTRVTLASMKHDTRAMRGCDQSHSIKVVWKRRAQRPPLLWVLLGIHLSQFSYFVYMCDNVSLLLVMHEYVHHVVGHVCAFHGYYTCVPLPEFTSMTFCIWHMLIQSCAYDTWFYVLCTRDSICTVVCCLCTCVSLHIQMHLLLSLHMSSCVRVCPYLTCVCTHQLNACLHAHGLCKCTHACTASFSV